MTGKQFPHVAEIVRHGLWAILPATYEAIYAMLVRHEQGIDLTAEEMTALIGAGPSTRASSRAGAVAVIPVYGVIAPRATLMSEMSGGTSTQQLQQAIATALDDPQVASILLDIDSPGGTVGGVPEAAATIRAARQEKPVTAMVNTMAGSAAYWLASQAGEIVMSPSAQAGSIGVFAAHDDLSALRENLGVKTSLVVSQVSPHKVEGNPFEPLTDDARSYLQGQVDEMAGMFVGDVAKGRGVPVGTVRTDFGGGRMLTAKNAVKAGMADRVDTFQGTVGRLLRGQVAAPRTNVAQAFISAGITPTQWRIDAGYQPEPYRQEADETIQCPECGKMNEPDAKFCDQCGVELEGRTDVNDGDGDEAAEALTTEPESSEELTPAVHAAASGWEHLLEHDGFRRALSSAHGDPLHKEA